MRRRDFLCILGGSAASWPMAVRGEQQAKAMPTVGVLWHAGSEQEEALFLGALRQGLHDLGYSEGRNIKLVNTYAAEQYDRFAKNALDLVAKNVDVIVAVTRPAALAAQRATRTIPVVAVVVPDPVGSGLVASLARPGGNITGLSNMGVDLVAKRVELLNEAVDGLTKVVVMVNPDDPNLAKTYVTESDAAAGRLKLSIQIVEVKTPEELDAGFAAIAPSGKTGIIVNNDSMLLSQGERIARMAIARGMPTMAFISLMAKEGALLSYGPSILPIFRRSATFVDKILKGARPAELPVEQPTDYQLFVNLKTAKALGLTIPTALIGRADEVME
jgi:putative tryptophan/tyrosine transport system substrate-binding protein